MPDDVNLFGAGGGVSDLFTDNVVLEPLASISVKRASYAGIDKRTGNARILYKILPSIIGSKDTQVTVSLVCKKDCLNEQVYRLKSYILDNNKAGGDLLAQVLTLPYRFDTVRIEMSYTDASGKKVVMPPQDYDILFEDSTFPPDCTLLSSYDGSSSSGFKCSRFVDTSVKVEFENFEASKSSYSAYSDTLKLDSSAKVILTLPGSSDAITYDYISNAVSQQASLDDVKNTRFWGYILLNEKGNGLAMKEPNADTLLQPGENALSSKLGDIFKLNILKYLGIEVRSNVKSTFLTGSDIVTNVVLNNPAASSARYLVVFNGSTNKYSVSSSPVKKNRGCLR